jgi:hypothetical protein
MRLPARPGLLLARVLQIVTAVVVATIGLSIAFVVLGANAGNAIVSHIDDWANTLAAPFVNIFVLSSHKGTVALSYALAIVVYCTATAIITRVLHTPAVSEAQRPRTPATRAENVPSEPPARAV